MRNKIIKLMITKMILKHVWLGSGASTSFEDYTKSVLLFKGEQFLRFQGKGQYLSKNGIIFPLFKMSFSHFLIP